MRAYAFANGADDPCYDSFRDLRTRRVIDYGWRTAGDLVDGADFDAYDLNPSTVSIVLGSGGKAKAGARFTLIQSSPLESISFRMWDSNESQMRIDERFSEEFLAGRLVDMTRLVADENTSPSLLMLVIGACAAHSEGYQGAYFTASKLLRRLISVMGIEYQSIRNGSIGGVEASLLVVYRDAWQNVATPKGQMLIDQGGQMLTDTTLVH